MNNLYKFGSWYSYTPDIEIKKKGGKYGIVYLPTGETLLPFEYENILINGDAINNFFIVRNGLFGAVHFEGVRDCTNDLFTETADLTPYKEKPTLCCDVPCKYDYFDRLFCGQAVFYNNRENVYLYTADQNTVIHFEEINLFDYSIWCRKNNTLFLVSLGEIEYSEPFNGFRFYLSNPFPSEYSDFESNDKLIKDGKKFTLIKGTDQNNNNERQSI